MDVICSFRVESGTAAQVLGSFRDNLVTGPDAATLSAQELRDELHVCSLAVRKLLLSEIEADIVPQRLRTMTTNSFPVTVARVGFSGPSSSVHI